MTNNIPPTTPQRNPPQAFIAPPPEHKIVELPCENCGKPVKVMLPFLGCIFCSECTTPKAPYMTYGTEDFISRTRR